ncbi:MAG: hypothetical protein KatS3mg081_2712 [Gemmatimonadales bacterium]|nr:MAG: hypothetical protein KatS3mg081_2712 [Gemmatimonadales bacterium]
MRGRRLSSQFWRSGTRLASGWNCVVYILLGSISAPAVALGQTWTVMAGAGGALVRSEGFAWPALALESAPVVSLGLEDRLAHWLGILAEVRYTPKAGGVVQPWCGEWRFGDCPDDPSFRALRRVESRNMELFLLNTVWPDVARPVYILAGFYVGRHLWCSQSDHYALLVRREPMSPQRFPWCGIRRNIDVGFGAGVGVEVSLVGQLFRIEARHSRGVLMISRLLGSWPARLAFGYYGNSGVCLDTLDLAHRCWCRAGWV